MDNNAKDILDLIIILIKIPLLLLIIYYVFFSHIVSLDFPINFF